MPWNQIFLKKVAEFRTSGSREQCTRPTEKKITSAGKCTKRTSQTEAKEMDS